MSDADEIGHRTFVVHDDVEATFTVLADRERQKIDIVLGAGRIVLELPLRPQLAQQLADRVNEALAKLRS